MSLEWPGFLWALALVPVAVLAYLFGQRRRTRYAVRFTNLDLLANVVPRSPGWRRHLPPALYLLALTGLLLSLARPQAVTLVPKEQATVMLVMDTSGSMNATDVAPSRMIAAEQAANLFLDELPDKFRVGVVAFSGTAQILTRPTTDRTAVQDSLASLHAEGPTAMGDAIERALEARLPPTATVPTSTLANGQGSVPTTTAPDLSKQPPTVILLLSDGSNTQGRTQPLDAARHARQLNVPVFTISLGTDTGMVDVPDETTGQLRRIPVPPDKFTLRRVAEATGGRFFAAPSGKDLKGVYQDLGSKIGLVRQKQEVTVVFAAASLLLLVAGAGLALIWFSRFP
ncbi:MAG TPA: VWA domain-containing protein [Actinomycetota bacterium]|jgi:Ca-activated chloride channel family protein|nr:VWA domain-containing protein [Actinomycetota bacterium]